MSSSTISNKRASRRQLFPEKLWDLVHRPHSGIQWSPDGKRILVERCQLEKFACTKFRSQNFDSFIRQLHFYGFRKCGNSYHHDLFQKGHPETLLAMKRKYSNTISAKVESNPLSTPTSSLTPNPHLQNSPLTKSSSGSISTSANVPTTPTTNISPSSSYPNHASFSLQNTSYALQDMVIYAITPNSDLNAQLCESWPKFLVISQKEGEKMMAYFIV